MGIHPIQGFKKMSTAKKVATVATAAAAIGVTALAISKGMKSDAFTKLKASEETVKFGQKAKTVLGEGFKEIGRTIKNIPALLKQKVQAIKLKKAPEAPVQAPEVPEVPVQA